MVGPSSDSRLWFGGDPGWGKLCHKRAGVPVAEAVGGDRSLARTNVQTAAMEAISLNRSPRRSTRASKAAPIGNPVA